MPEVKIEKWVYGGTGLGRAEGRVVLTPFVLPGETVEYEAVKVKSDLIEARAAKIVEPSSERVEAPCPHFAKCGGCHYQMAGAEFQLAQKTAIVREVLKRVGKLDAPETIETIAGEPWGYRNRIQVHVHSHNLGFKAAGSNKVIDVAECPLAAPILNEAIGQLRMLRRDPHFPRFLKEVELFTNGEQTMVNVLETEGGRGVAKGFFEWLGRFIPGAAEGSLEYETANGPFRVSHKSFFQVNRFLLDAMVERATERAEGENGMDLYAGVGLFTLPLSKKFARVAGVESDGSAVRDLEFNAERAQAPVKAHRLQSEQYLENVKRTPDFVLADPPRAGLGKGVVKNLVRLGPKRMHIVSCDPATLARDLAALVAAGYGIERMTVVDLFPQTYHVETITELVKN